MASVRRRANSSGSTTTHVKSASIVRIAQVPTSNRDSTRSAGAASRNACISGRETGTAAIRSEEHTSELQSHVNLVCRLLLEKKKYTNSFTSGMSMETNQDHLWVWYGLLKS